MPNNRMYMAKLDNVELVKGYNNIPLTIDELFERVPKVINGNGISLYLRINHLPLIIGEGDDHIVIRIDYITQGGYLANKNLIATGNHIYEAMYNMYKILIESGLAI